LLIFIKLLSRLLFLELFFFKTVVFISLNSLPLDRGFAFHAKKPHL